MNFEQMMDKKKKDKSDIKVQLVENTKHSYNNYDDNYIKTTLLTLMKRFIDF